MCGIGAVACLDGSHLGESGDVLLRGLVDALAHRGPDDREILRDGPVGMAFTRLSLTDPVSGSQPLKTDDGSLVLIANGEVYNHRELLASLPAGTTMRTGSDCEVLLHLYRQHGLNFLDDVRGMFGLILWDKRNNHLILARDRFGIKPLYYHRDGRRIILASEIKALFTDPRTPRRFDWERALTTPAVPAAVYLTEDAYPTTWFEGISSVGAGTIQRIDLTDGSTREHRYWKFPGDADDVPTTADGFVEKYRALLAESVHECATSDAELGLFLSGGIDSAAVAAFAAERVSELHTFTVLAATTYHSGDAYYGHRVAKDLGLPNHQVVFDTQRVPDAQEWKRLLWLVESPFCGPEMYYKHELHRYAKSARPQLRGMLLGAASDEFNGGYSADVAGDGAWSDFDRNIRAMHRVGSLRNRPDLAPWWSLPGQSLISDEAVRRWAQPAHDDAYLAYLAGQYSKLQQYNVWHEDRTAAGSGIEARVPFLDHRLVELVAAVPPHLREELLWDKTILRRGMRGTLADDVVHRPKQPFFHGPGLQYTYRMVLAMLERDGGALVEESLAAPGAADLIDADGLRRTLKDLRERPADAQVEIALRVVNLGLLSAMAHDLPAPVKQLPLSAPPSSVEVADWAAQERTLEEVTGLSLGLRPDDVPRLAPSVLLLTEPADERRRYLAVDGVIEYVLDDDEPQYRDFLARVDGVTRLQEVLQEIECDWTSAERMLRDLVEQGVVEFR
ncbi:asparagine synthase (glutamine-hydrolyzing) [Actinoplanes regularis]|uniref:asparagine synthase (glutamine-hydrolyzing) n=1 Tax=Actinoplanes regularis TaxID=52697 RepID=A0A238X5E3_9ACTN|nr:asparagine synthase (glutamine-hydrolyzing) [Actinoplanes regularis]GIE86444.1 asparagine synthetase [glutamine-hydrolyzing] 2 [Actinoplanes regularis]SNR53920.1 asparagine synthase (glutamine-hydrolysing) [Actinoplanes regularis]